MAVMCGIICYMTASATTLRQTERRHIPGYDIAVRRGGERDATAIVFVHGIGVSSRYFLPLMHDLASDYTVLALDLPGYGCSPKPARPLTVSELAEVVASYIRQEGLHAPVIVGHSMGGQVAAHVARHYPELCQKLILLGPTANRRERTWWLQAWRLFQDAWNERPQTNALIFRDYLRMGLVRYLVTLRYMLDDRIEATLRGCSVPTLLVRGRQDKIVPSDWLHYLARQLRRPSMIETLDGPHALQMSRPRELAEIIRAFVQKE